MLRNQVDQNERKNSVNQIASSNSKLKAMDIERWSEKISARSEFPVLIRTLIKSTCMELSEIDFPGYELSETPGWDGYVKSNDQSVYVPRGKSGWELSIQKHNISNKASSDFNKRTAETDELERSETTFVFVTTRNWRGKKNWSNNKKSNGKWEGGWRDVKAYDASDLEQWLEYSVPAQLLLDSKKEKKFVLSSFWERWQADCEPEFPIGLFKESISKNYLKLEHFFEGENSGLLKICSDSFDEGLAFLYSALTDKLFDGNNVLERLVVFEKAGELRRCIGESPNLIPVFSKRKIAQEYSELGLKTPAIHIVGKESDYNGQPIQLEPVSPSYFNYVLGSKRISSERVADLYRESAGSLTVLRRRLSKSQLLYPKWSTDDKLARKLIPFAFAGSWNTSNGEDQTALSNLAGRKFNKLEEDLNKLSQISDSPIWKEEYVQGVQSKLDSFLGVRKFITKSELDRFYSEAERIFNISGDSSEKRTGSFDEQLSSTPVEVSGALKFNVCDTVLLLSKIGNEYFTEQLGISTREEAGRLFAKLLTDLDASKLESLITYFKFFAEAAPDVFLDLVEKKIIANRKLKEFIMKPYEMFSRNIRCDLLWSLEILAWYPKYLPRVVNILADLAKFEPEDNLANKPSSSLTNIFRWQFPQTFANYEQILKLFDNLVEKHPEVAWDLGKVQYDSRDQVFNRNTSPKWKNFLPEEEFEACEKKSIEFPIHCLKAAISWKSHTVKSLSELIVIAFGHLNEDKLKEYHGDIWDVVREWAKTANDKDKAALREKIRTSVSLGSVGPKKSVAKKVYDEISPKNIYVKHAWLFDAYCVLRSHDELKSKTPFKRLDTKYRKLRKNALTEIYEKHGIKGIEKFCAVVNCPRLIGDVLPQIIKTKNGLLEICKTIIAKYNTDNHSNFWLFFECMLERLNSDQLKKSLNLVGRVNDSDKKMHLLLQFPFKREVWNFAKKINGKFESDYWKSIRIENKSVLKEELEFVVRKLLSAERPIDAFRLCEMEFDSIEANTLFDVVLNIHLKSRTLDRGQLDYYCIVEAIDYLKNSGEISRADLARLEFAYIGLYECRNQNQILDLELEISEDPSLFCEAVKSYNSDDSDYSDEDMSNTWSNLFTFFNLLRLTPGSQPNGKIEYKKLRNWILKARDLSSQVNLIESCDSQIGKLLSKSKPNQDNIWPCIEVANAIEEYSSSAMIDGIYCGRINERGTTVKAIDAKGDQERKTAEIYGQWSRKYRDTHPNVARILSRLEEYYLKDAKGEDMRVALNRRLAI